MGRTPNVGKKVLSASAQSRRTGRDSVRSHPRTPGRQEAIESKGARPSHTVEGRVRQAGGDVVHFQVSFWLMLPLFVLMLALGIFGRIAFGQAIPWSFVGRTSDVPPNPGEGTRRAPGTQEADLWQHYW